MSPVYKLSANSVKNGRTVYGSMLAGNPAYTPPSWYDSLATVTVGSGGSSAVTFSSIPSTYAHLQLRIMSRSDRSAGNDNLGFRFNSDTGSNYAWHRIEANGSSVSADAGTNQTSLNVQTIMSGATRTTGIFGVAIVDILDYANTNKFKTVRSLSGYDSNGAGVLEFDSGLWRSTDAITSIECKYYSLNNSSVQYSHFALYGIKVAS